MSEINKDAEKKEKLQKELEIENILAETHEMADREKMKKTARRYAVKPKITEIYSNADQKPRLINANPLELDEEKKEPENAIVGEKTATTIQAELIMEGSEDSVKTPEEALREQEEKKPEVAAEHEIPKIVTLTPEYAEETQFAGEVLEEFFRETDYSAAEPLYRYALSDTYLLTK